jgi:hypothetical protein
MKKKRKKGGGIKRRVSQPDCQSKNDTSKYHKIRRKATTRDTKLRGRKTTSRTPSPSQGPARIHNNNTMEKQIFSEHHTVNKTRNQNSGESNK